MVEIQNVGETISSARKALGLTQAKMVTLFNKTEPTGFRITQGSLAKYETNRVDPPTIKWLKFMAIFKEKRERILRDLQLTS